MFLRGVGAFVAVVAVAALLPGAGAVAATSRGPTVVVRTDAQLAAAVRRLAVSGGTIVLRRGRYGHLVVGPRGWRPLHIVGRPGASVGGARLEGTQRVSLGRVTLSPSRADAEIEIWRSRHVELHDLVVSAAHSGHSASILVADGRHVAIRRSTFSHCGDHDPEFVNCITLYRWTHDVRIEANRFHDCFGCDFINGRFGSDLTIRDNRFDRALPCHMSAYRCRHNDLVQLFGGKRLHVVRNHFGVYREGGAQLYLTNDVDYATIVNNVFVGRDARVPGYRARVAMVVGSQRSQRMPLHARIVNNTILTGHRRRDGYAGSIRMSSRYGAVPRWQRPIVANNVIGLLETAGRVCGFAQRFVGNLVIEGRGCSVDDLVGPVYLDGRGRPTDGSPAIDGGNRHFAPATDATGRRRDGWPDVGAFEYVQPG
jgi:hypothetical protein